MLEAFGDVRLSEANDPKSARFQPGSPTFITKPSSVVKLTTDLHHQSG
jgi:hypothetical protein